MGSDELHKQLEGMKIYESYKNKIQSLQSEQRYLSQEIEQLTEELRKEEKDVTNLDKGSILVYYLKIRGKYEETKNKEILEAAAASMKLDNKKSELEEVNRDIERLRSEQKEYRDCESRYEHLYDEKLQELLATDNMIQKELLELQSQMTAAKHNIKEIKEAISAGNRVMMELEALEDSLDSASGLGTWDLLGGGMLADLMKHSHLDDAQESLKRVQDRLRSFKTELADVNMSFNIQIDTNGFSKFADFFFDGFFADINMKHRIDDALNQTQSSKKNLAQILTRLEQSQRQEESTVKRLEQAISEFVINH